MDGAVARDEGLEECRRGESPSRERRRRVRDISCASWWKGGLENIPDSNFLLHGC